MKKVEIMDMKKLWARCEMRSSLLFGVRPGSLEYNQLAQHLVPLIINLGTALTEEADDDHVYDSVDWRPGQCDNGFLSVLGSSGAGKTEAFKRIAKEIVRHGIPILVFDFHGDVEIPWINSVLLSSGTASTVGVNPLQLTSFDAERTGLIEQRMALAGMLRRAIPTLSPNQMAILTAAMAEAYRRVGIRDEWVETWHSPPPSISMVTEVLMEWCYSHPLYGSRSVMGCINAVQAVFSHPVFNRQHNLDVTSLLMASSRLDLSAVDDSIRFIVAETVLRMVFAALRRQGPIPVDPAGDHERFRLFIMIDEAKILAMGKGDPNGRDRILNVLATEGRKYGIGLILASQLSLHFGDDVKGNIGARLVLRPSDWYEARKNALEIGVQPNELLCLRGKGEGFFRQGSDKAVKLQMVQSRKPMYPMDEM